MVCNKLFSGVFRLRGDRLGLNQQAKIENFQPQWRLEMADDNGAILIAPHGMACAAAAAGG